jgi:type I restriction enzyme S subunit
MSSRLYEEQFKNLSEIGSVGRGKSKHRPRNAPELYGGSFPFIQTGNVKHSNFYITNYTQTYSDKGLAQSKLWPPGTLCITIAANIADTAILTFPACFPDSIIGFIPKRGIADVKFVKYCLDTYKQQMQLISQGTTQDNLSLEKLLSIRLMIPTFATQQKIAAVLSAYDDLIENNKRRIALLEKMAEEIYREWFVRMRFPGHEKAKFEKGVPEGWEQKPSNEVLDVLSGGTPKTDVPAYWDGHIPFFTPKDAADNFYVLNTEKNITEKGLRTCNSRLYKKDTIFITARGTVGKLVLANRDMAMNQSCYALLPKSGRDVYFYFVAIKTAISYIKGVSKSGVFDNIIVDTFKVVPILMPTDELVKRFNELIRPLFQQTATLLQENEILVETRNRLLPRLISGKLSVENMHIQFPPSMLEETDAHPKAGAHAGAPLRN